MQLYLSQALVQTHSEELKRQAQARRAAQVVPATRVVAIPRPHALVRVLRVAVLGL